MAKKGRKKHKPGKSGSSGASSSGQNPKNPEPQNVKIEETQWDITRRTNKERFLEELASDEARGVIYIAAERSRVGLTTIYDYMKQDKDFADQIRATRVAVGGAFVESKLFERIAGVQVQSKDGETVYTTPPSVQAIRTYLLSEIGAEMGYKPISKQEIDGQMQQNFAILEVPDNGRSVKQEAADE